MRQIPLVVAVFALAAVAVGSVLFRPAENWPKSTIRRVSAGGCANP